MVLLSWWHWIIIGFAMIVAQFVIPSFTVVWFGVGGLFTGVIKLLWPSCPLAAQILTWLLSSLAFDALWFKYMRKKSGEVREGFTIFSTNGDHGVIIRGAGAYERAIVKFEGPMGGSDEWPCTAEVPLSFGDRVKVLDFSDKVIKVMKLMR